MISSSVDKVVGLAYGFEDRLVRYFRRFPRNVRSDSSPFLSSDTYFFQANLRIDCPEDLMQIDGVSSEGVIYVNGNLIEEIWDELTGRLEELHKRFDCIIVGDTDKTLAKSQIILLSQLFKQGWIVNLLTRDEENVFPLPLGLESQRYRSAGQLRDFKKLPDLNPKHRHIGILVAWNDSTNIEKRSQARRIIRESDHVHEIHERLNARYLHRLMRKTLLVPCPAGNGFDTHRFWESLYLGALPVIVQEDYIPAYEEWPHVSFANWNDLQSLTRYEIEKIYCEHQSALSQIRRKSELFITNLKKELS